MQNSNEYIDDKRIFFYFPSINREYILNNSLFSTYNTLTPEKWFKIETNRRDFIENYLYFSMKIDKKIIKLILSKDNIAACMGAYIILNNFEKDKKW